jgi:hemoglobin/transferrin/lactoferrin receptor protein
LPRLFEQRASKTLFKTYLKNSLIAQASPSSIPIPNFKAEFFVNYSGWKRLEDYNLIGEDNYAYATVNGMPSWYTLNLRMNYAFNKYASLQVACENILDQNYRNYASNISAPGRNFIVTLRGNF